jgi:nicotinate dehydrogenase subunit A
MLPVQAVAGQEVTTIEGLGSPERPHPLQAAFIEEQAAQCGYCTPGIVMAAKAVLDRTPRPTEAQVKEALVEVLCRCGTHDRVIRAVMKAAATMGGR